MSKAARLTLLFVVFVDLIGQGLVFPIINGLVMEADAGFLPPDTPLGRRHFDFGLVIGVFFLAWFFGVVYVSRLSDAIGRKNALLVCLAGALAGYVVSILALWLDSLLLLILGRAITGFTAGNQPIAQAAMIDASASPAERDRNMGYIVTGVSLGLVGGPIIGGILSDRSLLGDMASYSLPLWAALALVGLAIGLVLVFFEDIRTVRQPFVFRPLDVIDSLAQIARRPLVMQLMPVYAFFMIANVTFYIFVDNYLTSAFGYGVVGGSAVMMVIGFAVATSGTFLVGPSQQRFAKRDILRATLVVMVVSILAFAFLPVAVLTFVPVFVFYLFFGVTYPMLLGIFSGSVGQDDQGWVMGVTTAVFCLAGGVVSLIGGFLMSFDIRLPFYIAATSAGLALVFYARGWNHPGIRKLTGRLGEQE